MLYATSEVMTQPNTQTLKEKFEEIFATCTAEDLAQGKRPIIEKLLAAVVSYNAQCVGEREIKDRNDDLDLLTYKDIRNDMRSEIAEKQKTLLGRDK